MNRIGEEIRRRRVAAGWSLSELARRAGLSRQTLLAVEHGTVPRVDTALRIAEALGTTVEALWAGVPEPTWLGPPAPYARWGHVGPRLVLVAARDGDADVALRGNGTLEPLPGAREPDRVAVLAGCDPLWPAWARRFETDARPYAALVVHANSRQALEWWQAGLVHLAGLHGAAAAGVAAAVAELPARVVRAFRWEVGVAAPTLAAAQAWETAWGSGAFALREPGAAARLLAETRARQAGLGPAPPASPLVRSHLHAAEAVASGLAAATVTTRAAAAFYGLRFVPWDAEPFDWLIAPDPDPALRVWIEFLRSPHLVPWLKRMPGYHLAEAGRIVLQRRGAHHPPADARRRRGTRPAAGPGPTTG
jgi:transcriptional regulator with XRE-family HTH domain